MTLFRGLFVRKDATRGTNAVEARKSLAGIFLPSGAHGARPGVLDGLTVAGTAGWAYSVAAGHVVLSRSAADGAILAGNDAGASVSTSPAPASGSRIDLIWLKHFDVDAGDPASEIALGVTEGTAAASPVAPVLPAGAFELARATVAAGASSTSHASVTITATATQTGMRGGQVTAPTLASLEALYPSAPAGLTAWVTSENGVYVRSGGQWRLLWRDTTWTTIQTQTASRPLIEARLASDGQSVSLYINGPLSMATGSTVVLADGAVPAALRPTTRDPRVAITADLYQITLIITRSGGMTVVNTSGAARTTFNGAAATYPLG